MAGLRPYWRCKGKLRDEGSEAREVGGDGVGGVFMVERLYDGFFTFCSYIDARTIGAYSSSGLHSMHCHPPRSSLVTIVHPRRNIVHALQYTTLECGRKYFTYENATGTQLIAVVYSAQWLVHCILPVLAMHARHLDRTNTIRRTNRRLLRHLLH